MPEVARRGDGFSTGHPCDGSSTIAEGSGSVFADGIPVSRRGDMSASHDFLAGDICIPHTVPISGGSGSVFVNGIAVARKGDGIDLGAITEGSATVFAG